MKNDLIVYYNPRSVISESIKSIKTNLLFTAVDNKLKTILITSSIPGEGKSFVSSNLAISFAQSNNRVLLVDCDMRKGRLHNTFNVVNDVGLSDLLIKEDYNVQEYAKQTNIPNLNLITMGSVPPNPLELLSSTKFSKFLELIENMYDIIILDSTPVSVVADSLVLAKLVDQVVIVSSCNKTDIDDLLNTKKALLNAGGKISGVILNRTKMSTKTYYGKYYK